MRRRDVLLGAAAVSAGVLTGGAAELESIVTRYTNDRGDDVTVEVMLRGKGPLVLMVPSLGRGPADFDDLSIRISDAGYTAGAICPRGIGRSGGPPARSLADYARDAAAAVRVMSTTSLVREARDRPNQSALIVNRNTAVLVGHAFGNRVVRAAAAAYPDVVAGLVLLAAGGQVAIPPDVARTLNDVFDTSFTPEAHMAAVRRGFFARGSKAEVWRGGWFPAVAHEQQAALAATPPDSWTGAGEAPILVVQAEEDVIAPPANAEALVKAHPDRVRVITLPHAGHAMLPEQPEKIGEIVIGYLNSLQA